MLARLTLGKRLTLAFATLVLMSIGLVAIAAFGLNVATTGLHGITGRLIPINTITASAKVALYASRGAHAALIVGAGRPKAVAQAQGQWAAAQRDLDKAMQDYLALADNAKMQASLATFRQYIDTYRTAVAPIAARLDSPGDGAQALDGEQVLAKADQALAPAMEMVANIEAELVQNSARIFAKVDGAIGGIFAVLIGLCMACTAAAALLAWRIKRSIMLPVQEATQFAEGMAAGDLSRAPRAAGGDELAHMVQVLARMQLSVADIVGQVRQTSESVQVASNEVATGNADLSMRTEQAASSLQQTASALEQLADTVRQTADSAGAANELALSASDAASRGGSVVSQVVATMDEIARASSRIADIIGTIDSIAFQTNILALNAAVEAARAGEQGRGFAVVAGEVRALASRAAAAAREIKQLIGASTVTVENGARLVGDAGSTMTEIVGSVRRVADLIGEISLSASEQSQGLGQISVAVGQLDQATQQNAALVEESAAAAESLKDQAARLSSAVGVFRLAQ